MWPLDTMVDEMTLVLMVLGFGVDTDTGGTTLPLGVPVTEVVTPVEVVLPGVEVGDLFSQHDLFKSFFSNL